MKISNSINLNPVIGVTIAKTLEFSGVVKSKEEIDAFCLGLTKDDDFIEACKDMIKGFGEE